MASFSERMRRQWRHWMTTTASGRAMFPPETLERVAQAIGAGEQRHRGELRLIVENAMPSEAIWHDVDNRQRAIALFSEFGVWDTEDNCGVLLYVNVAEHKVEIVADRGINRKIDGATWQHVCTTMTSGFARGNFHDSLLTAVEQVNTLLATHFPATGARANELSDQPLVL